METFSSESIERTGSPKGAAGGTPAHHARMDAFPRITLLAAFAAAGVALAVCVALVVSAPLHPSEEKPSPRESPLVAVVKDAETPSAPPLLAGLAPEPAAILPRVAQGQVAQEEKGADEPASDKPGNRDPEMTRWMSDLLDVVKLQATSNQATQMREANSAPEETEAREPDQALEQPIPAQRADDASLEPLPQPSAKQPTIERSGGDDRLRVTVQDSDIRDVLELLSQEGDLNILPTKSVTGSVSASLVGVDVESALVAILRSTGFVARREGKFIYVGTPEDFQQMDQTADVLTTRVYRPNYVRAAELQTLIAPLLTTGIGKVTVSTPALMDIPASQTNTGGDMLSGTDVVIVKDYERVLLQMDQLVQEVDCRPRQVLLDAMIISVKLSDENKFGINWQLLKHKANVRLGLGTPPASAGSIGFDDGGLTFGFVDDSLGNLIVALETIGETNVVAAPRLLCLNKQRAEIQIGEQLGYVSTTVTETSSTQSIQFLDVGTLLRLRPFISGDGSIRMEIHPELSTGTVEVDQGLTLPNKEVTQVTTNVMCQNGSTVIIGGLIREDLQTDVDQIPVLGNIPIAGALFRQRIDKTDRREILVLITPRLVDEPVLSQEGAKAGNDFLRRQNVVFDKMSPIGRRHHAMQYHRKAKAAWAAGDDKVALKYANLAVHFDPMSREAIALREEIACVAAPDESVGEYLQQGIHLGHHPHKDYSRKGSPWKDSDPLMPDSNMLDTWTPGEPGKTLRIDTPPAPPAGINHAKRGTTTVRK